MKVIFLRCDCKTKVVKGIKTPLPEHEQVNVAVYKSIDSRWLSGTCVKCGKQKIIKNE